MPSWKILGTIGSILMLFWFIFPHFGGAFAVSGLILVLIAVRDISREKGKNSIFRDFLIASIFLLPFIVLSSAFMAAAYYSIELISQLFWTFLPYLAVLWILSILGSVFLRRSFKAIAEATGNNVFRITANLYLISALLLLTAIGFLILFLAIFLQTFAFISAK